MTTTAEPSIENLERILAQQEEVRHLTDGPDLSQFNAASATLADLHLFDILNRFDVVTLNKRLEENPELFFPLINAFCNFSSLKLAREKFEWQKQQAQARQRAREEKQRRRQPIVINANTLRSVRVLLEPSISTECKSVNSAIDPDKKSETPPDHLRSRLAPHPHTCSPSIEVTADQAWPSVTPSRPTEDAPRRLAADCNGRFSRVEQQFQIVSNDLKPPTAIPRDSIASPS
jgi:hypothetical protein